MTFELIRSIEGIIWLVVGVDYPPAGIEADVSDIGGGGHDDGDGVDKRQEKLPPTTEVVRHHVITNCKRNDKHDHRGEDKADCETAKVWVAILEQPPPIQDVACEVKQGECQFCEKMFGEGETQL